ncbi:MAG: hypothetical protein KAT26_10450 [Marinosulfonomonas sp.]|nr:hypothetical protein [Marinosulfonomonas sp.]
MTMFIGTVILREAVPPQRWLGAGMAFGGLVWLLWPGGGAAPPLAGSLLVLAGVGVSMRR